MLQIFVPAVVQEEHLDHVPLVHFEGFQILFSLERRLEVEGEVLLLADSLSHLEEQYSVSLVDL